MKKTKLITGKRGSGKTTRAIKEAYKTNAIILTVTEYHAKFIEEFSKNIGMPVKAMNWYNIDKLRGIHDVNIVIDQIDWLMPSGIPRLNIIAMTSELNINLVKIDGLIFKIKELYYKLRWMIKHGF